MRNRVITIKIAAFCLALSLLISVYAGCSGFESGSINNSGQNDPTGSDNISGKTVTISFDTGMAGVTVNPIKGQSGQMVTPPADPQATDRAFVCWQLNGVDYDFTVFPDMDITLTAKWNSAFYVVKFDTGVASEAATVNVVNGQTVKPITTAPREGQVFRCWTLNNKYFDLNTPVTSDITLKGVWVEKTNLPTVIIELYNDKGATVNISSVQKDSPVLSTISVLDSNGNYFVENGASNFKGRGNGSWKKPKKGYKIKFDKKQELFGRQANKHWVLLPCQNFPDGTMLNNFTAFTMGREIFDNIGYSPFTVWVDVYVNGAYYGVYDFTEHVRVAKGRVDIESEYGVNDTGYLIELDALATSSRNGIDYFGVSTSSSSSGGGRAGSSGSTDNYTLHSPSPEDFATDGQLTETQFKSQVSWIKDKVQAMYTAVCATTKNYSTICELLDENSLIDMYILEEFYKNSDVGHSSLFVYKKPGGKFYFGPPWDFDWTTTHSSDGAGNYTNRDNAQGIYVAGNVKNKYTIFTEMYKVSQYKSKVIARWKVLSPKIQKYVNELFTSEFYAANRYALGKNFVKWPWPENTSQSQAKWEEAWVNECEHLKGWFNDRITFLNGEWK